MFYIVSIFIGRQHTWQAERDIVYRFCQSVRPPVCSVLVFCLNESTNITHF